MLYHAIRSLGRSPTFTATAIATLALGIGATTAIFTIVNAALFRPLPYPNPEELVVLTTPSARASTGQLFLFVRDRVPAMASIAAQGGGTGWNLTAGTVVTSVRDQRVSEAFFATHRIAPLLGREFSRADETPGSSDVAIISERLWRRAFDGNVNVLGQSVLLGSAPYTIVGVVPDSLGTMADVDLWTPLRTSTSDNGANYLVVGRLRGGVTLAQAAAAIDSIRPAIHQEFPRYAAEYIGLLTWIPYRAYVGFGMRRTSLILLGAVGFLLLIACVNVASLHLTRALGRRQEMALRGALGASRMRLLRDVFVESMVLSVIGAAAGLGLALVSARALVGLVSEQTAAQMLSGETLAIDWRVLAFTIGISVVCGLLFGMAPAFTSMRADLRSRASEGLTTTMSTRTVLLRRTFAGAQVALAVVLLVGAGLLIRTLSNLVGTDPGFRPDGVLIGRMSLQGAIDPRELEMLVERGLESVRRIPGVASASVSNAVPIERALNLPLAPPADAQITDVRSVDWRFATPDYFDVFQIRVVAGRAFDASDGAGGNPVAIVNESFARGYFGRLNAVGETIGLIQNFNDPPRQIVGVIADVKGRSGAGWTRGLTALGSDVAPMMIVPTGQAVTVVANRGRQRVWDLTWSIRTQASRPQLERDMRDTVQTIDARMVFREFEPMAALVRRDLDAPRLVATLLTGFALLAIVLASIGLYGLMAYAATQRAREVGIRIALGATAAEILKRFLSEGLAVAAAGIIAGLIGAASMSRVLTTLLFGVRPLDIQTFASVLSVLLVVATLAALVPALRAARIDPVKALRAD